MRRAVIGGDHDLARSLLSHKLDIQCQAEILESDSLGRNSLHLAIEKNDTMMAKLLLDADGESIINIPISIKDKEQTPLHMAVQDSSIAMVRVLMTFY